MDTLLKPPIDCSFEAMSGIEFELNEGPQVSISVSSEQLDAAASRREDNVEGRDVKANASESALTDNVSGSCGNLSRVPSGMQCNLLKRKVPACDVTEEEDATITLKNGVSKQIQNVLDSLQTCKDLSSYKCLDLIDVDRTSASELQSEQLIWKLLKLIPDMKQFCYEWKSDSGIYRSTGHWYTMLESFLQLMPKLEFLAIIKTDKSKAVATDLKLKDPFPKFERLTCFAEGLLPQSVCQSALSVNSTITTLVTSLSCIFNSSMLPNLKHLTVYLSANQDEHLITLTLLQSPVEVLTIRYCDKVKLEHLRTCFAVINHFGSTLKQLNLDLPLNCNGGVLECSQLSELTLDLGGMTRVEISKEADGWVHWMEEGITKLLTPLKNLQQVRILNWNVDHLQWALPPGDDNQHERIKLLQVKLGKFVKVLFAKVGHLEKVQFQMCSEDYTDLDMDEFPFFYSC